MKDLPENRRHSSSDSSNSSDCSVRVERDQGAGSVSTSKDVEDSIDVVSNGVSVNNGSGSSSTSGYFNSFSMYGFCSVFLFEL